jgi:acyl-CoA reductase-like NAD-dependent aldehyde dehydrogenase
VKVGKDAVSRIARRLQEQQREWRERSLKEKGRYCQMLWIGLRDHAATFSSLLSTNSPFTNLAPALTNGTSR